MSEKKKDFYGKEVADAIKSACAELKVAQEDLDIEVVETGSTGIFGLRRKKAHIRAVVKEELLSESSEDNTIQVEPEQPQEEVAELDDSGVVEEEEQDTQTVSEDATPQEDEEPELEDDSESEEIAELSSEHVEMIRQELGQILELMGYPATVNVEVEGTSAHCRIESELEDVLIGQDGKILDSMQYLLRKMIAKKIPDRLRLSVDVGNYRERRRDELKVRAVDLAAQVKEDGKTQVIPALSPSERRVVHMALQDDKEIRSRSVGDGLFKKILIYKPGKGKKGGGRKHSGSHGRRNNGQRSKKDA